MALLRQISGVLNRTGALSKGVYPLLSGRYGLYPPHLRLLSSLSAGSRQGRIAAGADTLLVPGNWQNSKRRGYKNFGHQEEKEPMYTKLFLMFLSTVMVGACLDWKKLGAAVGWPKVDADAGVEMGKKASSSQELDQEEEEDSDSEVDAQGKKKSRKEKIGFRDRKIIEYENRLRTFATADKVFRYFSTIKLLHGETSTVYMTPYDFLRAITPGMKQPEGLGLDQYKRYDAKSVSSRLDLHLDSDSIFYKLGAYGLISFSDYIFLLTVLSTSRRHFEIAFRMFDLNGDGDVDSEEFEKVANLIRQQTSIGNRHRDHANTGNTFKVKKGVNSALTTYFFGPKNDEKLTIEKFLDFQQQLQREILTLEFLRKNPDENGNISEADFAELLLAYAGYPQKKKVKKIKRVKKRFRDHGSGISKEDYLNFFHFLNNINDVDTALTFYHIAGASIDQDTLKHVARTVALVELSSHVIDVVFTIFDENMDGQLSNREFVAVMKNRLLRGLEKPKDTGFVKLMHSILKCAKDTKPVLLDL
ncbi:calcium uptake protein 1 homolog, mitochondrial-like isoform X1 [Anopheles moucheti]|uniref:calcium uptake protein 1 homolog, mitochondrial-like isoform X1 n=1 Tax=Anopheles moucheti TaxID=186751 RepID=UPI0022EFEF3E|nr:calcium uptake protein 1 homolog, mitochondrial-like isoform X1 [Anopheles moucheti]XP_052899026.1 calcium uptake protein 1 homolog, mitochondrial-like isoform X1 [Anopheles moucheti]XP_052899028.1 calcium uptake protein 1 homolog, mitochondrial-like isoform X1 [Anopheles moucheti]